MLDAAAARRDWLPGVDLGVDAEGRGRRNRLRTREYVGGEARGTVSERRWKLKQRRMS